jgi:hypothetical protein
MKVNWARVIGGGLLAGLVGNLLQIAYGLLMRKQVEAAMRAANREFVPTPAVIVSHFLWTFVIGIAAIWLYAAIRPRYGAGPRTAVRAGFAVWLFAHATFAIATVTLGLFPASLMAIEAAWGLIERLVSTLAGAAIYREQSRAAS